MLTAALAEGLRALTDLPPTWLLYVGACLGHAYVWTVALNVLYGNALPHWVLKFTRKVDILFILSAPIIFWIALDMWGDGRLQWSGRGVRALLATYALFCSVFGLIIGPVA